MNKEFNLAVVQCEFKPKEVNYNLLKIEQIVQNCKFKYPNIRLIVFPELATTGYILDKTTSLLSQSSEGSDFQRLSIIAKETNIYIVYGYVERDEEGKIYNSIQLIGPDGVSIANYRKIHLTPMEHGIFEAGREIVAIETDIGKIGLMICWDLAFPELARILALQGVDLLVVPSAWEDPYSDAYEKFSIARAIDNTVFLATSNHIGTSGPLHFFGKSSIYGPDGKLLISGEAYKEEVHVTKIDITNRTTLKNEFFSMLEERRTDLY